MATQVQMGDKAYKSWATLHRTEHNRIELSKRRPTQTAPSPSCWFRMLIKL